MQKLVNLVISLHIDIYSEIIWVVLSWEIHMLTYCIPFHFSWFTGIVLFLLFGYLNISPASCEYTFKVIRVSISIYHFSKVLIIKIYSLLVVHYLIKGLLDLFVLRRDIESNPGPRRNYSQYLSFCHWNRNSLPSQNYIKLSLLQAFSIVSKFDIFLFQRLILICLLALTKSY